MTTSPVTEERVAALRSRLEFMRGDLINRLIDNGIEAGFLGLLGSVGAALRALDETPLGETTVVDMGIPISQRRA
jgi:hypothetical protein